MSQCNPPQNFSLYTKYFRYLMIPRLIDHSLQRLFELSPIRSREALNILIETLYSGRESYYKLVVEENDNMVRRIVTQGFSNLGSGTLRFCVPLEDGEVFELFPYGAFIEVNPNNYDYFITLLSAYRRLSAVCTKTAVHTAYAREVVAFLPLNTQSNLLNENFSAILDFMQEHLLNPASLWYISLEEVWRKLEITYTVSFHCRIFPVSRTKTCRDLVPFAEAFNYVALARKKLQQLESLSSRKHSLNDALTDAPKLSLLLSSHNFYDSSAVGSSSCQDPSGTAEPSTSGDEEQRFWNWLHHLAAHPQEVQRGKMSFVLRLPHGELVLKENGEYISVTPQNVRHFVSLVEQRRKEVHQLFLRTPPPHAYAYAPASKNSDSLYQYSPAQSATWNHFALVLDDLQNNFFDQMRMLRERFESNEVLEEELREYHFYIPSKRGIYELIPGGRYIHVNKQNANEYFLRIEEEYQKLLNQHDMQHIQRSKANILEAEYEGENRAGGSGGEATASHNKLVSNGVVSRKGNRTPAVAVPPPKSHALQTRRPWSSPDFSEVKNAVSNTILGTGMNNDSNKTKQAYAQDAPIFTGSASCGDPVTSSSAFLDERDLTFLNEFETHISSMFSDAVTDELVNALQFKWCIVIPDKNYSIPLKPNGCSLPVTKDNFIKFLKMAVNKVREIRRFILECNRYPPLQPPQGSATAVVQSRDFLVQMRSTQQRNEAAQTIPSDTERELFTPRHAASGFSPLSQHSNS